MDTTIISLEDFVFEQVKDGVKANFMKNYFFIISEEELKKIGQYSIDEGNLIFKEREKRVWNKFNNILDKGFRELTHKLRNKPCIYIHRDSGIPLIGSNEFGIVDRGSNIIEIKPMTGCNLSCTFCSVSEGVNDKTDILVEEEYIIEEFKKICELKEHDVEANIGPQGEPLLYPKIVKLVKDLKENGASVVSINTNGTVLSEKLIDDFTEAGLDRINLSIHTLNQDQANRLMGGFQDLEKLKRIIRYCEGKIDVLLAPVLIPNINDNQLDDIIELGKTINNKKWPSIGIQNFLIYPGGRNPGTKERKWDDFFGILKEKEEKHKFNLTLKGGENFFQIYSEKTLPKPFKKGQTISVTIKSKGRNGNEWLATAQDRVITVRQGTGLKPESRLNVKLLRDKHNIFTATPA